MEVWEADTAVQGGDTMRVKAQIIIMIVAIIMTFYPAFGIDFKTAMQIVCPIQMGFILWIAVK